MGLASRWSAPWPESDLSAAAVPDLLVCWQGHLQGQAQRLGHPAPQEGTALTQAVHQVYQLEHAGCGQQGPGSENNVP